MIEESNDNLREDLKEEVTETYTLIGNTFKSASFFLDILSESIINFIDFFTNKEKK